MIFVAHDNVTLSCFVKQWLRALSTSLALSNETALEYFRLVNMWTVRKQTLGPNSARSAGLSTGSALKERLINERAKCHIQARGPKHFDLPHKSPHKIMRFPVTRVSSHTAPRARFTKWVSLKESVVLHSAHAGELHVRKMHKPALPFDFMMWNEHLHKFLWILAKLCKFSTCKLLL